MQSVFENGGIIGRTQSFTNAQRYGTLSYVGGRGENITFTQTPSYALTGLAGGSASAPAAGDLVIVAVGFADTADRDITCTTSGFVEIADLYANDTYDSNLAVFYKVLTTAETSVAFNLGTATAGSGATFVCHVWRGFDPVIFDTTRTTASVTNTGVPNAPAITTVTANSIVLAIGHAAASGTLSTLTAPSGMSNFVVGTTSTAGSTQLGIASFLQTTAGTYDPAAFGGGSTNTANSYNAVTIALRTGMPGSANARNSGIWKLSAAYDAL